jgi:hypothetical protein
LPCNIADIPNRLHRNNRPEVPEFRQNELVFRRFPDSFGNPPEDHYSSVDKKVKKNTFDVRGLSCYRDSFCDSFEDALYNDHGGAHFFNWGVLSFITAQLNDQSFTHPNTRIIYVLKVLHEPTECLYPHSEVHVFSGNQKIMEPSSIIKSWLRDTYLELYDIIKEPEE